MAGTNYDLVEMQMLGVEWVCIHCRGYMRDLEDMYTCLHTLGHHFHRYYYLKEPTEDPYYWDSYHEVSCPTCRRKTRKTRGCKRKFIEEG